MIQLIKDNKFEELKEYLKISSDFQIHKFLLEVLEKNKIEIDGESFSAKKYQEEFIEGLEIYLALEKSNINELQLKEYSNILVELAFKMCGFIQLMANTAMNKGAYLSDMEELYKVRPEIREKLQVFIDILKHRGDQDKAIANIAAAKAQVSNSIENLLEKFEIGEDMLQFAQSYVQIGQTQLATKIYQGIMNDFECESVRNSSGLFPEISQIETRPKEEIAIFEKAKINLEKLTGEKTPEIKRVSIDDSELAKKLVDESEKPAEDKIEDFNTLEKDLEKEKINGILYNKIVTASAQLLNKENDKNTNVMAVFESLMEIVENENLNQISDIYIYEQGYNESEEKLKNTILHAITTIIAFEYKEEHFQYLENIVMLDRDEKGPLALDYILKLGRFHEKFKNSVLDFIEENLLAFSREQLSITAWYLINLYAPEPRVQTLIIRAIDDKTTIAAFKNSKDSEIEINSKIIEEERRIEKENELERIKKYYFDREQKKIAKEEQKRINAIFKDKRDFLTRILHKLFN
jgi:hypothetical protein